MTGLLYFWKSFLVLMNKRYNKIFYKNSRIQTSYGSLYPAGLYLEIFLFINKPGSPGSKYGKITEKNADACKIYRSAGRNASDHLACLRKRKYAYDISQNPRDFFC